MKNSILRFNSRFNIPEERIRRREEDRPEEVIQSYPKCSPEIQTWKKGEIKEYKDGMK